MFICVQHKLNYLESVPDNRILVDDLCHPVEELDDQFGHVVAGRSLEQTKVVFAKNPRGFVTINERQGSHPPCHQS